MLHIVKAISTNVEVGRGHTSENPIARLWRSTINFAYPSELCAMGGVICRYTIDVCHSFDHKLITMLVTH